MVSPSVARKKRVKNAASPKALREAAVRIADSDGMVRSMGWNRWEVASESSPGSWHAVTVTEKGIRCECRYHTERKSACRHAMAIEIMMLREAGSVEPGEPVVLEGVPVCCPACRSSRFKRNGTRRRTHRGEGQRYRCLNPGCGKGFTGDLGFGGRHVPPEAILMALMIFSMGVSPYGIVLVLGQRMGVCVHRTTVQRWADAYARMVERYAAGLRPGVGRMWSCDEKFVRAQGRDHWVFTVRDMATRFILSWDISSKKINYDAKRLFAGAGERAGHAPLILKTDGLGAFRRAFRRVFGRSRNPKPVHFRESHIRNEHSDNNGHERLNGTLGELLHGARGLQKADPTLVRAAILHYNFVRPHQGLGGRTPAAAAGIAIRGDVWLTLIQNAALASA